MNLPNLKITDVSEDLKLKAARALYIKEDGASGGDGGSSSCSGNGGLASAADLGMLPKVAMGGSNRVEDKRRKQRMQSEESFNTDPAANTDTSVDDTDTASATETNTPSDSAATASTAKASLAERAERLYEQYDNALKAITSLGYMVSWIDSRRVGKLHPDQQKLDNGLFYVEFDKEEAAYKFYDELKNVGVDNLKIDCLGGIKKK